MKEIRLFAYTNKSALGLLLLGVLNLILFEHGRTALSGYGANIELHNELKNSNMSFYLSYLWPFMLLALLSSTLSTQLTADKNLLRNRLNVGAQVTLWGLAGGMKWLYSVN